MKDIQRDIEMTVATIIIIIIIIIIIMTGTTIIIIGHHVAREAGSALAATC